MDNHHFLCVNPLEIAIFNSYFDITRGYHDVSPSNLQLRPSRPARYRTNSHTKTTCCWTLRLFVAELVEHAIGNGASQSLPGGMQPMKGGIFNTEHMGKYRFKRQTTWTSYNYFDISGVDSRLIVTNQIKLHLWAPPCIIVDALAMFQRWKPRPWPVPPTWCLALVGFSSWVISRVGGKTWQWRQENWSLSGWWFRPLWKILANEKDYPIYYGK